MSARFDIAFSLAREQRQLVEPIAVLLRHLGYKVFYYGWPEYEAELSVPDLDLNLRRIYGEQSRLLVPVLSSDYARKPWTNRVEFLIMREFIIDKPQAVMPLRADDSPIEGFSRLHGYLELRGRPSDEIADRITRHLHGIDESNVGASASKPGPSPAEPSAWSVTVPPLPRWYVPRETVLQRAKQVIDAATKDPSILAIAVYGMPGVGKTTFAQALCDPLIRGPRFESAAWITVGREPRDLRSLIREAAIALSANAADYDRDDVVVNRFRELLRRSDMSVVLDDVWHVEHVQPFLVQAARSRILFTTRERTIATSVGAEEIHLETMAPEEARRMLRLWAGRDDPDYDALAKRLGYHPLGLRLAGTRLRETDQTAAAWLASFEKLSDLRQDLVANKNDDLSVCFGLSTERFRAEDILLFYSLGIFPYQVVTPVETVLRLWRQLGTQREEGALLLAQFERSGLVNRTFGGIEMHDLLRQYARENLGDRVRTMHSQFLKSYGAIDDEHVPEDADPYYLRFSSYHFRGAEISRGRAAKFGSEDFLGWVRATFHFANRKRALPRPLPETEQLPDAAKLAIMGSWGTGLYGAPVIADSLLKSGPYTLLMHLGDIFYTGREVEVRERFLRFWPTGVATFSRALNGNHEMYSGGIGYFDHVLSAFGQTSSYFTFSNSDWMLICLDTAYVDADIDSEQLQWVEAMLAQRAGRKVALFSHHYLYSVFDSTAAVIKLRVALGDIIRSGVVRAWYWAHEMRCVLYDRNAADGNIHARCIGHGGFPTKRTKQVRNLPEETSSHGISWRRFPVSKGSPSGRILDGPNPYLVGREESYLPHGYATLEFDGPRLTERVFLADGSLVMQTEID